jgi:hypothetical protein
MNTSRRGDLAGSRISVRVGGGASLRRLERALGRSVPPNWFPLVPTRTASGDVPELVVRQMADDPQVPTGTLLRLGAAFDDDRIPREGRRIVREHVLARWSDGSTTHLCRPAS